MTSEFGRGYAVCLRQFLWHEPRLSEYVQDYADWGQKYPDLFGRERGIEMWCDGAVDHLHDLVRPRRYVTRADWLAAKQLQQAMYDGKWGRNFDTGETIPMSEADVRRWLGVADTLLADYARRADVPVPTTFEAAWALDEAAGLKPQRGDAATCEGPIPTRRRPVPA